MTYRADYHRQSSKGGNLSPTGNDSDCNTGATGKLPRPRQLREQVAAVHHALSQSPSPADALAAEQKKQIHYKVIESSGRDNAKFTKGTDRLRIMGKVGILVTAAFATYEILNADNKVKETARQGMIVGGGAAGGFLAGLGVSLICGPGAPFCAIALVLAGGAIGGIAGGMAADALDDELEEFSKWEVF